MRDRLTIIRIVHPFPSLLVAVLTLAVVPLADRSAPAGRYVALGLGMLLYQFAVGLLNDVTDIPEDRRTKPWKPLVRGLISPRLALMLTAAFTLLALLVTLTLPPTAWAIGLAGFGCGVVYDLYLKRTQFSWLPYAVGLPLVPLWVYAACRAWRPELWWTLPLGALLGFALQLANEAPDVAAGAQSGLPARLGERNSRILAVASFAIAVVGVVLLLLASSPQRAWYAASLGGVTVAAAPWSSRMLGRNGLFGLFAVVGSALALLFLSSL